MKSRIEYSDEPMDEVAVVDDFLPPPEDLALREETVKVTLQLTRSSVEFFKREAAIHHTPYQRMIRRLLNEYTSRHADR